MTDTRDIRLRRLPDHERIAMLKKNVLSRIEMVSRHNLLNCSIDYV